LDDGWRDPRLVGVRLGSISAKPAEKRGLAARMVLPAKAVLFIELQASRLKAGRRRFCAPL
jgi:hypothetical protein